MPTYKLNLFSAERADAPWRNKSKSSGSPESLGDGWSVDYAVGAEPFSSVSEGNGPTSGDASWVDTNLAWRSSHYTLDDTVWRTLRIFGPASTAFALEVFSSASVGADVELRVSGGPPQVLAAKNNVSETVVLSGTTDATGETTFQYRKPVGATSSGGVNALRLTPVAGPVVSYDTDPTPGGTSVLTYSNFDAAPTGTVTATPLDSNGDPIVGFTPLTYTGTVANTDTAGVHSGTITVNWPALVDGETTLPFGTNNVRLSITS